jgi:hypothetical protein
VKVSQHVACAIDDAGTGKFDSALLHACIAIDGTSRRLFPITTQVGKRYKNCLRHYYWLIEPMLVGGMNLDETRFENIQLKKNQSPDLADIIYEVFRCNHAHGEEVPTTFSVIPTNGGFNSEWVLEKDHLHVPDRIIWALLAVVVFSKVNAKETIDPKYFLTLGDEKFVISEWWGREKDFVSIAARYNKTRVKFEKLGLLSPDGTVIEELVIKQEG